MIKYDQLDESVAGYCNRKLIGSAGIRQMILEALAEADPSQVLSEASNPNLDNFLQQQFKDAFEFNGRKRDTVNSPKNPSARRINLGAGLTAEAFLNALNSETLPHVAAENLGKGVHGSRHPTVKVVHDKLGEENYWLYGAVEGGLLKTQVLGFALEHAVAEGLSKTSSIQGAQTDPNVAQHWNGASDEDREEFEKIYNAAARLVQSRADLFGKNAAGAKCSGKACGLVDVSNKFIDIHVKLGSDRGWGLQAVSTASGKKVVMNAKRLAQDLDGEWPAAAQWKHARNTFAENKFGKPIKELGREEELKLYTDFREDLFEYLAKENVEQAIKDSWLRFFTDALTKEVYFAHFNRTSDKLSLQVKRIAVSADKLTVDRIHMGTHMYGLKVVDAEDYAMTLEMRTSGQGHPPQTHFTKSLKCTATVDEASAVCVNEKIQEAVLIEIVGSGEAEIT